MTQISSHQREATVLKRMAEGMPPLSHLECLECGRREEVGDVSAKLSSGWPVCHGYTMRLFTQAEQATRLT